MTDVSFYGIFASLIFLTLSGIGLLVLIVSLIISLVTNRSNRKGWINQSSFGYVIGSLVPIFTGLVALYTVVSIKDTEVLKAFDNVVSFVVTVFGIACMLYIARRWKRNRSKV